MAKNTESVSLSFKKEHLERFKDLKTETRRSLSSLVEQAVEYWFAAGALTAPQQTSMALQPSPRRNLKGNPAEN